MENHTFYSLLATAFLIFLKCAALIEIVEETNTEVMFGNTVNNFWYITNIFITFYLALLFILARPFVVVLVMCN